MGSQLTCFQLQRNHSNVDSQLNFQNTMHRVPPPPPRRPIPPPPPQDDEDSEDDDYYQQRKNKNKNKKKCNQNHHVTHFKKNTLNVPSPELWTKRGSTSKSKTSMRISVHSVHTPPSSIISALSPATSPVSRSSCSSCTSCSGSSSSSSSSSSGSSSSSCSSSSESSTSSGCDSPITPTSPIMNKNRLYVTSPTPVLNNNNNHLTLKTLDTNSFDHSSQYSQISQLSVLSQLSTVTVQTAQTAQTTDTRISDLSLAVNCPAISVRVDDEKDEEEEDEDDECSTIYRPTAAEESIASASSSDDDDKHDYYQNEEDEEEENDGTISEINEIMPFVNIRRGHYATISTMSQLSQQTVQIHDELDHDERVEIEVEDVNDDETERVQDRYNDDDERVQDLATNELFVHENDTNYYKDTKPEGQQRITCRHSVSISNGDINFVTKMDKGQKDKLHRCLSSLSVISQISKVSLNINGGLIKVKSTSHPPSTVSTDMSSISTDEFEIYGGDNSPMHPLAIQNLKKYIQDKEVSQDDEASYVD